MGEDKQAHLPSIMLGRTSAMRALRVGSRRMSGAVEKAAAGEVQVWRPKVKVTRHLSPHEMEIITPASKWLNYQKNAVIENALDWIPGAIFFFTLMYTGNHYHGKWAREHAMHGGDDE